MKSAFTKHTAHSAFQTSLLKHLSESVAEISVHAALGIIPSPCLGDQRGYYSAPTENGGAVSLEFILLCLCHRPSHRGGNLLGVLTEFVSKINIRAAERNARHYLSRDGRGVFRGRTYPLSAAIFTRRAEPAKVLSHAHNHAPALLRVKRQASVLAFFQHLMHCAQRKLQRIKIFRIFLLINKSHRADHIPGTSHRLSVLRHCGLRKELGQKRRGENGGYSVLGQSRKKSCQPG